MKVFVSWRKRREDRTRKLAGREEDKMVKQATKKRTQAQKRISKHKTTESSADIQRRK